MLDPRLQLAAAMYEPCDLGADIGTDHAYLPRFLLQRDVCRQMILTDISPHALQHARETVEEAGLEDRTTLVLADGLSPLQKNPCGCISIMGMGGETLAGILRGGVDCLNGAVLVLSAHTDLPTVRAAIRDIHYHPTREEVAYASGRPYLLWRCEPGEVSWTETDLRLGTLLLTNSLPEARQYLKKQVEVLRHKCQGLLSASTPNHELIAQIQADIALLTQVLSKNA